MDIQGSDNSKTLIKVIGKFCLFKVSAFLRSFLKTHSHGIKIIFFDLLSQLNYNNKVLWSQS